MTENYTKIVLDEASVEEDYDKFLAKLPENDGRYAVYDFAYSTSDGERNKLVFVSW